MIPLILKHRFHNFQFAPGIKSEAPALIVCSLSTLYNNLTVFLFESDI